MLPSLANLTLQTISPAAAHLCLRVENFIQKELKLSLAHKKVLVGFSGGVDSTALLLIFYLLKPRLDLTLAAAHVNHSIRVEAGRDQAFCQDFCQHLSIPFYTTTIDVPGKCPRGTGLEETARTVRYDFFSSLMTALDYDFLLTGHQLNDLAEDCLMRLLRGAGWPALAGMSAFTPLRSQVRPLLMHSKDSLVNFLAYLNIPHVVDITNADDFSLRNRIRHRIIPEFLRENPRFLDRIAALWAQARIDEEGVAEQLSSIMKTTAESLRSKGNEENPGTTIVITRKELENLPKSLRLRAYKHVLDALGPGQTLSKTLLKLDSAWVEKRSRTVFQFPHGKTARIDKRTIFFQKLI